MRCWSAAQEPQQGGELLFDVAGKAVEQRDRQTGDVERRNQAALATGAKGLSVKVDATTHQRTRVRQSIPGTVRSVPGAQASCQAASPRSTSRPWRIDFAAEKAQRGRGHPLATAIRRTAEAEALAIRVAQPAGQPRGLRANCAESSAPPHKRQPAARAVAERSWSKTRSCSWNLASASTAWFKGSVL